MDVAQTIEQLIAQRESILDIWKNLLTVSLAIIAYFGVVRSDVSRNTVYILISLFTLFTASNLRAIVKNFSIREELVLANETLSPVIEKLKLDDVVLSHQEALLSLLVPGNNIQWLNIGFHVVVDVVVILTMLSLSGIWSPLSNNSRLTLKDTTT
jgi:hypothetical protein